MLNTKSFYTHRTYQSESEETHTHMLLTMSTGGKGTHAATAISAFIVRPRGSRSQL